MSRTRILIAVVLLALIVGGVLGVDALRRRSGQPGATVENEPTVTPGSIPIRLDRRLVASFGPDDLQQLPSVSFVDAEEGKTQEGWLLRDVLLLHIQEDELEDDSIITVASSSRSKSVQLTWVEVNDPGNYVMFDLSNRGTLKLVSMLEELDTREDWIQDVDSIDISEP